MILSGAPGHGGSDEALVLDAHRQSTLTHAHPRSQIACALYCLWARSIMAGRGLSLDGPLQRLRAIYQRTQPDFDRELESAILTFESPKGSGYVVDTLFSAAQSLNGATCYEGAIRAAIALGDDTDTTAAVTGGLAALHWGLESIPARWINALRGREVIQGVIGALKGSLGSQSIARGDGRGSGLRLPHGVSRKPTAE